MRRTTITGVLIIILLIIGTAVAVLYAKGYRISTQNGKIIAGTGLLAITSRPDGARVYLNDHLTTATNNTINLAPGTYEVKIEKDGYIPWKKKIIIKNEAVTEATATLFPAAPKLEAVTTTGANSPILDDSGSLIAYTASSSSTAKNGVYVLDMTSRNIFPLGGASTLLASDNLDRFSSANLSFSPEGDELIASISADLGTTYYLLNSKAATNNPKDITNTLFQAQTDWDKQASDKHKKLLSSIPSKARPIAEAYFKNMVVSPDADRVLYEASQSAKLPLVKNPRIPSFNSTPEDRNLKQGSYYVWDIKEDRNYLVYDSEANNFDPKLLWHPDDNHLIYVQDKRVYVVEFDGQNRTVVYAGPFNDNFVAPWPDGSSLVILTNLTVPDLSQNLYRISLR